MRNSLLSLIFSLGLVSCVGINYQERNPVLDHFIPQNKELPFAQVLKEMNVEEYDQVNDCYRVSLPIDSGSKVLWTNRPAYNIQNIRLLMDWQREDKVEIQLRFELINPHPENQFSLEWRSRKVTLKSEQLPPYFRH